MAAIKGDLKKPLLNEKRSLLKKILQERLEQKNRYPLSSSQQQQWFMQQLAADTPYSHIAGAYHLFGRLDVNALERSLNQITRRHTILRTCFPKQEDGPVQRVLTNVTAPFFFIDLSNLNETEREQDLDKYLTLEIEKPFDLETRPAWRCCLFYLLPEHHLLLFTWHHLVMDGWSMGLFKKELAHFYKEFTGTNIDAGQINHLIPPPPIQFVDFASWEQKRLEELKGEELAFWKKKIGDVPGLELFPDHGPPEKPCYKGKKHPFRLSLELARHVRCLVREKQCTLYTFLLAAFQVFLYRYYSQEHFLLGSPFANRGLNEIQTVIGPVANLLVLPAQLHGNMSFIHLLESVGQTVIEIQARQSMPFNRLVEALQPNRSLDANPFFTIMFALYEPEEPLNLGDLKTRTFPLSFKPVHFHLEFHTWESGEDIEGCIVYNPGLFEEYSIANMKRHYVHLLSSIARNPGKPLKMLSMMGEAERNRTLFSLNSPHRHFPVTKSVPAIFEEQVKQNPKLPAVIYKQDIFTYLELDEAANRLSRILIKKNVARGTVVWICLQDGFHLAAAVLGVLKAGGIFIILDPLDPGARPGGFLPGLLLTHRQLVANFPADQWQYVFIEEEEWPEEDEIKPDLKVEPNQPAYVVRASGRGVKISHQAILTRTQWLQQKFPLSPPVKIMNRSPLTTGAVVWELLWPLLNGGTALFTPLAERNNPAALMALIHDYQVDVLHLQPGILNDIIQYAFKESIAMEPVKYLLVSGEMLPQNIIDKFYTGFSCPVYYLYGHPEVGTFACSYQCRHGEERPFAAAGKPANAPVYILDKNLEPLPPGVRGEIFIGGFNLVRGYPFNCEATEERFITNPVADIPGDQLFKTGDSGRWIRDSVLELLPPSRRQAWINGYRVELQELESYLISNSIITDCRVMIEWTRADIPSPELVIYLTAPEFLSDSPPVDVSFLPEAVISRINWVQVSNIPLTAGGNINEKELGQVPVINRQAADRWKEKLAAHHEIRQVAVLEHEKTGYPGALHLSEVLPDFNTQDSVVEQGVDTPREHTPTQQEHSGTLAISSGGLLTIPANAPRTLTEALLKTAAVYKDKGIYYINSDGSRDFQSYAALLEEAKQVLGGLLSAGLTRGKRVILQLDSLRIHLTTFWACILGGMTPVNIAIAPTYKERNGVVNKVANTWKLLEGPTVLTSQRLKNDIKGLEQLCHLENLEIIAVDQLETGNKIEKPVDCQPHDLLFFQLSSGSTGLPKCIQETHDGVIHHIHGARQFNGYEPGNICLNWLPVDHVVPILTFHLKDVYLGCTQVMVKTDYILSEPLRWLDLLEAFKVTHSWSPNFGFKLVSDRLNKVKKEKKARALSWDLSTMQFFMNGSEQVTLAVVKDFMDHVESFGVKRNAMQPAYGMAEVCTAMTYCSDFDYNTAVHTFDKNSLKGQLIPAERGAADTITFIDVGHVIPGVSIRITDKENQILPERVIGRLQIKGNVVTPGYLNNETANKESFVGDGWFNTGDLGFILNGRLILTGREKEMLNVRGANLYSHEVEDVVNNVNGVIPTFSGTCAIDDPSTGTESLAVFFVPEVKGNNREFKVADDISRAITENLGVTPSYVIPLEKKDFPKTTSGKIQRLKLKKSLLEGDYQEVLNASDLYQRNHRTIPDFFHRLKWVKREAEHGVKDITGHALIFCHHSHTGTLLIRALEEKYVSCTRVEIGDSFKRLRYDYYRLNPADPDDYIKLLTSLQGETIHINYIFHLWTYRKQDYPLDTNGLEKSSQYGVKSLLFLVRALNRFYNEKDDIRLFMISAHVQPVFPYEINAYEYSAVTGFLKTLDREISWLSCCHIDLEFKEPQINTKFILQELNAIPFNKEVAYRDNKRWIPLLEKIPLGNSGKKNLPFARGGFYVITGGLGGIGQVIAQYLLNTYEAFLLLIGKTPLPDENQWESILEQGGPAAEKIDAYLKLKQCKGKFMYEPVDVCDFQAVKQLGTRVGKYCDRPPDGIIHLAGIYHERLIVDETAASLSGSLAPKMTGTMALHGLLQDRGFFISFSSLYSFFGGINIGAYAAANSFLDGFTHYHHNRSSVKHYRLNWSLWEDTGMARGIKAREPLARRGFSIIPVKQALNAFLTALANYNHPLFIGLDSTRLPIESYLIGSSEQVRKLKAYFTLKESQSMPEVLNTLEVRDRFGRLCRCDLIQLQEMPLAESGEIDIPKLYALASQHSVSTYSPPATKIQEQLTKTWQEVLSIPKVGIHDNFFSLGGNSLIAVQVCDKMSRQFDREITLSDLFENPTTASLAKLLEKDTAAKAEFLDTLPPVTPVSRQQELPLSFAQESLWFIWRIQPKSAAYNMPLVIEFQGRFNIKALERSLESILQRHEILRTSFHKVKDNPLQVIGKIDAYKLPVRKIKLKEKAVDKGVSWSEIKEVTMQPFDLSAGIPIRTVLFRIDSQHHLLLVVVHHIAADAWSLGIFEKELHALYRAYSTGKSSPLPEPAYQFVDFAVWQRQMLKGQAYQKSLHYWKNQLEDIKNQVFPCEKTRPGKQSFKGTSLDITLPSSLVKSLEEFCRQQEVTMYMLLLAAYQTVLYQYSGQEHQVVGSPFANRRLEEWKNVIGFFANTLVIHTKINHTLTFTKFLHRVKQVVLEANMNQDFPFEILVKQLKPQRHLNRNPLFQVVFALQDAPAHAGQWPGLSVKKIDLEAGTTRFDMELHLWYDGEGMAGKWIYCSDLFDRQTVVGLKENFLSILNAVGENPETPLLDLPPTGPPAKMPLENHLALSHGGTVDIPPDMPTVLSAVLARAAEGAPKKEIIFIDSDGTTESLTYAHLFREARSIAAGLQQMGLRPGDKVILYIHRSRDFIPGFWGCVCAGVVPVPAGVTPVYDKEHHTVKRLHNSWRLLNKPLLLTGKDLETPISATFPGQPGLNTAVVETLRQHKPLKELPLVKPDDPVLFLLTSGTTGAAKIVVQTHQNLVAQAVGAIKVNNLTGEEVSFNWMPLDHVGGLVMSHLRDVFLACQQVHAPTSSILKWPVQWIEYMHKYRVTATWAPSFAYKLCLAYAQYIRQAAWNLSAVKIIINGGEPIDKQAAQKFLQLLEPHKLSPNAMRPAWGMSETCSGVTFSTDFTPNSSPKTKVFADVSRTGAVFQKSPWPPEANVHVGIPIPGISLRIVDKNNQILKQGVTGRLQVKGAPVTPGYYNNPEANQTAFTGDGWFDTGDLGFIHKGTLTIKGRAKELIILRGMNYHCSDLEAALSAIEDIEPGFIAACPVKNKNETSEKLALFFCPSSSFNGDSTGLDKKIREGLTYKTGANPDFVIPIEKGQFHRTETGKINRSRLAQDFAAGLFHPFGEESGRAAGPAANDDTVSSKIRQRGGKDTRSLSPVEQGLKKIWQEVLGIETIQLRDNFFSLGGSSLLALQVVDQIQKIYKKVLEPDVLFQAPTIERLAKRISRQTGITPGDCLVPIRPQGSKNPAFWVAPVMGTAFPYYHLATLLGKDQPFYALQPPGGKQKKIKRIEDTAAEYIEVIQAVQSQGPYFLGGWSIGGNVAFEMARQLVKEGHTVAHVAILDQPAFIPGNQPTFIDNLMFLTNTYMRNIKPYLKDYRYLVKSQKQNKPLDTRMNPHLATPENTAMAQLLSQNRQLLKMTQPGVLEMIAVTFAYSRSIAGYKVEPCQVPVTLFRVQKQLIKKSFDRTLGWKELAQKGVDVVFMPGNHMTLLREPHIFTVAEKLTSAMEQAGNRVNK